MLTWTIRNHPRTHYGSIRPGWHPHYRIRGGWIYNGARVSLREWRYALTFTADGLRHQEMGSHRTLTDAKQDANVDASVRLSTGGFAGIAQ